MTLSTSEERGYDPKDEKSKKGPRINQRGQSFREPWSYSDPTFTWYIGKLKAKEE